MDSRESPARIAVIVSGIVQGVGFRPFVYRLATEEGLSGFVRNDGRGVYAEAQGDPGRIESFLKRLRHEAPVAAAVLAVEAEAISPVDGDGFEILRSTERESKPLPITPDLAACGRCLEEVDDPSDRRHDYPFTNCTNCGPRFTIVTSVPYDRPNTTMNEFAMCDLCAKEYADPLDRRFHAEPIACPECGPRVELTERGGAKPQGAAARGETARGGEACGAKLRGPEALAQAGDLLRDGAVLAIKGIGGYHLACDAASEKAVSLLRARKLRYDRPFALMARDLETARGLCHVGEEERALLESSAAPIVLLRRKAGSGAVAPSVAPGLARLGIMLPYTPLHHMLFRRCPPVLVMTSGNASEEPIAYDDADAAARLEGLADAFLAHDRRIRTRCDDSVAWVPHVGRPQLVRRSRGYSPCPLPLPVAASRPLLAVGGHFKVAFCLAAAGTAYLSHHVGDMSNLEALESFEDGVAHFTELFSIHPQVVAFDMHPEYLTTKYALAAAAEPAGRAGGGNRFDRAIAVQHHHAHVASCMAENGVPLGERVLGVAFDGTGYGPDGTIWGGEFLICGYDDFRRFAHMGYMPLPGGEAAVSEPWRLGAYAAETLLGPGFHGEPLPLRRFVDLEKWKILSRALRGGVNAPLCCSVGRLFDCAASVLGIRGTVNYEGQAAVELEAAAHAWIEGAASRRAKIAHGRDVSSRGALTMPGLEALMDVACYDVDMREDTVPWEPIIGGVLRDALRGENAGLVSARFHRTIAEAVVRVANKARREEGAGAVALTGGVFVNALLHHLCAIMLEREGFAVLLHSQVPPNDGGIAYGQAAVAAARLAAATAPAAAGGR